MLDGTLPGAQPTGKVPHILKPSFGQHPAGRATLDPGGSVDHRRLPWVERCQALFQALNRDVVRTR
jgi:hypothetical protein